MFEYVVSVLGGSDIMGTYSSRSFFFLNKRSTKPYISSIRNGESGGSIVHVKPSEV